MVTVTDAVAVTVTTTVTIVVEDGVASTVVVSETAVTLVIKIVKAGGDVDEEEGERDDEIIDRG